MSDINKNLKPVRRRYYFSVIGILCLMIIGIMDYNYSTGNKLATHYSPLIDASGKIKFELTTAHLWLEEVLSGDREENISSVEKHFDLADRYAKAMLEGGSINNMNYTKIEDALLREKINSIRDKLSQLKEMTYVRYEAEEDAKVGTQIDQQYDKHFKLLMNSIDVVESDIKKIIDDDLSSYTLTQLIMLGSIIIISVLLTFVFFRYDNRRINDFLTIKDTYENLNAEIEERKKIDIKLKESEKKYRALFEKNIDGIAYHKIVTDENNNPIDYVFLEINDAFENLTGLKREKIIGKKVTEVIPGIEKSKFDWIGEYGKVALTGKELRIPEEYAEPLDMWYSISAYCPEKEHFATIFENITEHKKAEIERERLTHELEGKTNELEQIVFVSSHDLRSPLVNIQGFSKELEFNIKELQSFLENNNDTSKIKEYITGIFDKNVAESLNFIYKSTEKIDKLLAGLLLVSRLGRSVLTINKLDMNKIMDEIKSNFEYYIKKHDVSLEINELPYCYGDEVKINQLFSNLIDNALKYLDPKREGIVKVTGTIENKRSVYIIEDNGIGIKEDYQKKIFEIFHRLNPQETAGEGLGLTIVRRILERHSGDIKVESQPGAGSKFIVILNRVA